MKFLVGGFCSKFPVVEWALMQQGAGMDCRSQVFLRTQPLTPLFDVLQRCMKLNTWIYSLADKSMRRKVEMTNEGMEKTAAMQKADDEGEVEVDDDTNVEEQERVMVKRKKEEADLIFDGYAGIHSYMVLANG